MGMSPRSDKKLCFGGDRKGMPSFLIITTRVREVVSDHKSVGNISKSGVF